MDHQLEQMGSVTPLEGKDSSKADSRGPGGQTAQPDFSQAHKGLSLQIPHVFPNPQSPKSSLRS